MYTMDTLFQIIVQNSSNFTTFGYTVVTIMVVVIETIFCGRVINFSYILCIVYSYQNYDSLTYQLIDCTYLGN